MHIIAAFIYPRTCACACAAAAHCILDYGLGLDFGFPQYAAVGIENLKKVKVSDVIKITVSATWLTSGMPTVRGGMSGMWVRGSLNALLLLHSRARCRVCVNVCCLCCLEGRDCQLVIKALQP